MKKQLKFIVGLFAQMIAFLAAVWAGTALVWRVLASVSPKILGISFISVTLIQQAFATLIGIALLLGGIAHAYYKVSKEEKVEKVSPTV